VQSAARSPRACGRYQPKRRWFLYRISRIEGHDRVRYGEAGQGDPGKGAGGPSWSWRSSGRTTFTALNGAVFKFNEAISFQVAGESRRK